ncbi:hypothetical protein EIQ06_02000 [Xanthomonas campestris pv. campestris]|nr:hypothetical protein D0A42_11905 [Xanthomonas campestris pv. campestris]RFF74764.1 hypothetical protein DZE36_09760 [Xanthomonas campestris pv. campestris]
MVEGLAATAGTLGLQAASLEARDPQVVGSTAGRLQELLRQRDGGSTACLCKCRLAQVICSGLRACPPSESQHPARAMRTH